MRRKSITRNEVRIRGFEIQTMPEDSVRSRKWTWRVEPIERLWKPLVAELTREWEADAPRRQAHREELRRVVPMLKLGADEPPRMPYPTTGFATRCRHCERRFYRSRRSLSRYCTDACAKAAAAALRAPRIAEMIKAKSEARANARADRKCWRCGDPIAALRGTKKFCSTKCRMGYHRHEKRIKEFRQINGTLGRYAP
jgi:ribosomal protein S14